LIFLSSDVWAKRLSDQHLNHIYKKVAKQTNVNKKALKRAFNYYKRNQTKKGLSKRYLAIADYTKTAKHKRLYIINLQKGQIYRYKVAHGKRSGSFGGHVKRSSNKRNTKMSPYGFFKVGTKVRKTKKKRYPYLSVQGLQKSNRKVGYPSRMGGRDVIIHPAKYVNRGGRSHGCFAIRPQDRKNVFAKLKRALFYSYTGRS
jgi:lipoprotein-anchoring transpeptidase ErfK/SrfK